MEVQWIAADAGGELEVLPRKSMPEGLDILVVAG
jgi:hypothetical protein